MDASQKRRGPVGLLRTSRTARWLLAITIACATAYPLSFGVICRLAKCGFVSEEFAALVYSPLSDVRNSRLFRGQGRRLMSECGKALSGDEFVWHRIQRMTKEERMLLYERVGIQRMTNEERMQLHERIGILPVKPPAKNSGATP